jgi:23S rRNA (adenine2503-C2)-methyltransferase
MTTKDPAAPAREKVWLVGFDKPRMRSVMQALGEPAYRGDQLYRWIYARGEECFEGMTVFSRELQERIGLSYHGRIPLSEKQRQVSPDGTRRYLMELERDGLTVESVYIPDGRRRTVCLSTQVGCKRGCRFCRTASVGFRRSLDAGEIVGQFMAVRRDIGELKGWNVVLMGMGEPLDNAEASTLAVALLSDPAGLAISRNRITLSTVGVVPELEQLGRLPALPKIAVSLNAATDEVRSRLMPVNRRYPLKALLAACRAIPLTSGNRITFEYVMLSGVNDSDEDARRLPRLLAGIPCKVNLIPFNPWPGCGFAAPTEDRVERFQQILHEASVSSTIRRSRGSGIGAACGQLSGEIGTQEHFPD